MNGMAPDLEHFHVTGCLKTYHNGELAFERA